MEAVQWTEETLDRWRERRLKAVGGRVGAAEGYSARVPRGPPAARVPRPHRLGCRQWCIFLIPAESRGAPLRPLGRQAPYSPLVAQPFHCSNARTGRRSFAIRVAGGRRSSPTSSGYPPGRGYRRGHLVAHRHTVHAGALHVARSASSTWSEEATRRRMRHGVIGWVRSSPDA